MFGQTNEAAPAGANELIKDTTTAGFREDVLAESMRQPVLVDFWAPWCGPCKQMTPVIEKAVKGAGGKVKLAKMNIDEHPQIAGQLGIKSIPAVPHILERVLASHRRLFIWVGQGMPKKFWTLCPLNQPKMQKCKQRLPPLNLQCKPQILVRLGNLSVSLLPIQRIMKRALIWP